METTLFDSDDKSGTPGPSDGGDSPPGAPLAVSQVAQQVRSVLAGGLPSKLRVVGQVSNFSGRQHWFFSLKDESATLACVCFASSARRVGVVLADGMQVIATGRIDYYDTQGRLQFYVDNLEPVGQGVLELRYRALCDQLRQLGYFDSARKKPLPVIPRRVAVVTSRSAAALQDVIHTADRRWPGCQLMLLDVPVQGDAAAPRIAEAIDALTSDGAELEIDAVVLTRGGGSIEDLWAFNERIVADAIFACSLPVVAAIGHETDTTIAELVADVRCATPTQAIMTLIPDRQAMEHQLYQLSQRLKLLIQRQVQISAQRFDSLVGHPIFRRPERLFELIAQRLYGLVQRLDGGLPRRLKASQDHVQALAMRLEAISPINVLKRGYAYAIGPDGHVLRSVDGVQPGHRITTVLADGAVESQVQRVCHPSASDSPIQPGAGGTDSAPR